MAVPVLQGRVAELRTLSRTLEVLTKGRGGVHLVSGATGLGKTRLLAETAHRARRSGVHVAESAGDLLHGAAPLSTLVAALRSGDRPIIDGEAVDRLLGGGPLQRTWLLELLRRALEERSRTQPVLVVIDDLQCADPLTLLGLRSLVPTLGTSPVLWLLARHPVPNPPPLDRLWATLRAGGAVPMPLAPLGPEALEALAADLVGGPPDAFVLAQLERSGGVPALAVDLVRYLRAATEAGDPLPMTRLHCRVLLQLRAVSPGTRQLLEVASAYGPSFAVDDLAETLAWPISRLLPHVAEALRAGILEERGTRLGFRLELVREATYATLPAAFREVLDRQALAHGAGQGRSFHLVPGRQLNGHERDGDGEDGAGWERLTQAELRVARLVAQGLTNRGVADRLILSQHTVDSHLKHVFAKLGIRSRVQLTRTVLAHEDGARLVSLLP